MGAEGEEKGQEWREEEEGGGAGGRVGQWRRERERGSDGGVESLGEGRATEAGAGKTVRRSASLGSVVCAHGFAPLCVCVRACVRACAFVCACVRARACFSLSRLSLHAPACHPATHYPNLTTPRLLLPARPASEPAPARAGPSPAAPPSPPQPLALSSRRRSESPPPSSRSLLLLIPCGSEAAGIRTLERAQANPVRDLHVESNLIH